MKFVDDLNNNENSVLCAFVCVCAFKSNDDTNFGLNAGDHQHGGPFHPGDEERCLFRIPRPRRLHLALGHPRLLHHLSGGDCFVRLFPGHAHRPRADLHRAVERRLCCQRRRGCAAQISLQRRRQLVPAGRRLPLQARLRSQHRETNMQR